MRFVSPFRFHTTADSLQNECAKRPSDIALRVFCPWSCHTNDVETSGDPGLAGSEGFTDSPAHIVALHGIADLPAHASPKAAPAKIVPGYVYDQKLVARATLLGENPREVGPQS